MKENIINLDCEENSKVLNIDPINSKECLVEGPFDIVFIDPPYKEKKINEIIDIILKKKLLKQNGLIIIHRHKKDTTKITDKLRIFEERNYGISKILFGN